MSIDDVDGRAVRATLALLATRFRTKELSAHPDMLAAHRMFVDDRNYHATIGRYLSEHRDMLDLRRLEGDGSNVGWRKVGGSVVKGFAGF